jgi:hypothetical protein
LFNQAAAGDAAALHRRMNLRDGGFVDLERLRRLRRWQRDKREDECGNQLLEHPAMISRVTVSDRMCACFELAAS